MARVVVKRNNPTLLDVYGHWWVEIDEVESYGWWPAVRPVPVAKAIRGVPGALNGVGGPHGGSPTIDPRHGELADHAFHPVTRGDRSDDQIIAAIRRFAATFDGGWRWSIRPTVNCRSFQADLLTAAGLVVPEGYAHSAGAGCPFLASPRRWRDRLAHHRVNLRRADLSLPAEAGRATSGCGYTLSPNVYTRGVTKRLVDIDDDLLNDARAQLGTATIKGTVNEALRQAGAARRDDVAQALDVLGDAPWSPREDAWR